MKYTEDIPRTTSSREERLAIAATGGDHGPRLSEPVGELVRRGSKLVPCSASITRETVSPGRLEVLAKASSGFGDVNGCVVLRKWR